MTLPLSLPGVFAATLLTFIPAAGDFINAELLGGPNQAMIGNVIQSKFLALIDYPSAAALSFVLMALIVAVIAVYARIVGSERLVKRLRGRFLDVYAVLAIGYMLLPIAVVLLFSFNDPAGRFNYVWQSFTFDNWVNWDAVPGLRDALETSLADRGAGEPDRDDAGHADRARARARTPSAAGRRSTSSSSCRWPRRRSCSAPRC